MNFVDEIEKDIAELVKYREELETKLEQENKSNNLNAIKESIKNPIQEKTKETFIQYLLSFFKKKNNTVIVTQTQANVTEIDEYISEIQRLVNDFKNHNKIYYQHFSQKNSSISRFNLIDHDIRIEYIYICRNSYDIFYSYCPNEYFTDRKFETKDVNFAKEFIKKIAKMNVEFKYKKANMQKQIENFKIEG